MKKIILSGLFFIVISVTAQAQAIRLEMRDSLVFGSMLFPDFQGENLTFQNIEIQGISPYELRDSLNRFTSGIDTAYYDQQSIRLNKIVNNLELLKQYAKTLFNQLDAFDQDLTSGKIKNRKTKSGLIVPEPHELCPDIKCKNNETVQATLKGSNIECACTKITQNSKK